MFGAEPEERWSDEERAVFEQHVANRSHTCRKRAWWATGIFTLTNLAIVPFLAGHALHRYWGEAKYLIFVAEAELLWLVYCWALVYGSWQSARETRREFRDPED